MLTEEQEPHATAEPRVTEVNDGSCVSGAHPRPPVPDAGCATALSGVCSSSGSGLAPGLHL